jgi:gliding motility-associated-like protein
VNIIRPIYIPNVFSPDGDGINDFFYIQGGPASDGIEVLRIFDRWGAVVYEDFNIDLNDEYRGWDGTFRGKPVNSGVFTFHTNIHFLDNETLTYSGTITVVR